MVDDRGRELIDLNNNFTALIHGHAQPRILEAAADAMRDGTCFGLPTRYEWEHADELLRRFPALDQVCYMNSGTEAVMTAVRVARASTRRSGCIVVRDSYHGTSDVALSTGDARVRRGIPASVLEDVTRIGVNDAAGLQGALEREGEKYAAIIIDLLPSRAGLLPVERSFVKLARQLADQYGVVLIFDEVISFRLGFHGFGGEYGVDPDMIALGKAIGGGFPIGAIVGKERVMRELDLTSPDGLEHGGTFTANPVTMAAGIASLRMLTSEAVVRLNQLGDQIRRLIGEKLAAANWELRGYGSLLRPVPTGTLGTDKELHRRLFWAAYERGILLSQYRVAALSTPMDEEVVSYVADRLAEAVLAVG
jgi:glutamate-1-semialdehyde 2,1-aminomutase